MYATMAQADLEYATNVGAQRQDVEWIRSDRDVWYRNPYYTGPCGRHPEDEFQDDDGLPTTAPVTGCAADEWEDIEF